MREGDARGNAGGWHRKVAAALLISAPALLLMGGVLVYQLLVGTAEVIDKSTSRAWTDTEMWQLAIGLLLAGSGAWWGGLVCARSTRG